MKKSKDTAGRRLFDFDGNFYTYTGKIFDLIVVSVYWLLGCIPVITIGASFCALYAAVTKSVRHDRDSISKQFWHAYKQNLLPSIPLTLIYGGVIFAMLLNIGILDAKTDSLWGLFFIVLYAFTIVFFIVSACYVFPALSRFAMPTGWLVKLSFYMAVRHLPISILLFLLFAVSYLALLNQMALFLLIPGIVSFVASAMIEPLLERHVPKEENAGDGQN
ncbi:MAG TPA: DUF624 domain-containing protein [Candidatus Blautia faecavium]|uniref:DUF624 domain-containing protein n=1 Tax=Candidatus Blautia faecavium TaxID=2838487 RepID=A0A9D2LVE8_9FIRM|nr:DUF624 domain-containing protein [Candidatus Blautia faecavium]